MERKRSLPFLIVPALLVGLVVLLNSGPSFPADPPKAAKRHGKGYKPMPAAQRLALHERMARKHGDKMARLPKVTAPTWDCTTLGLVLPTNDQGPCGDCYGVSVADACSMAFVKAGLAKNDGSFRFSSQYGLDCDAFQGGCDGGDEAQVFAWAHSTGFPLTSDYGPYTANPGRCNLTSAMKLYKISDWGFCTPAQQEGVANTQDMKNAIATYGPISVAFDASECDSYTWPDTMTGNGRGVDHAVLSIGWDDGHDNGDGTKGAFLGLNQWGSQWGSPPPNAGRFWIKYGADSWGTEAIWCVVESPNPPPPPPPPGPGPGPSGPVTITLTPDQVASVIQQAGVSVSIVITPDTTIQQLIDALNQQAKKQGKQMPSVPVPPPLPQKTDQEGGKESACETKYRAMADELERQKRKTDALMRALREWDPVGLKLPADIATRKVQNN